MKLIPDAENNEETEELGEEYEVDLAHPREHTGSGFCWDMTCPCHEDGDCIHTLGEAVQEGHITTQEADRIYRGRNV